MDRARPGWIVFLDADEWLTDDTAAGLQACLHSFESVPGIELATLAPTIREAELDLDRLCPYGSPDAVYFRGLRELLDGPGARTEGLRTTMRTRRDARAMADSRLDPDGRALDALIGAYLHELKGQATADTYLAMCDPWIDPFFDASPLCRYGRRLQVRA
jgi:hypothetical protein